MSAPSMATARLMETCAHGLDVADALGVTRPATIRLRPVAHIGVRARDFAFVINGVPPPGEEFHVELRAPGGGVWSWGPAGAPQRVTGSAENFCLLALVADRAGVRRSTGPGSLTCGTGPGNPNLISGRLTGRDERTFRPAA